MPGLKGFGAHLQPMGGMAKDECWVVLLKWLGTRHNMAGFQPCSQSPPAGWPASHIILLYIGFAPGEL